MIYSAQTSSHTGTRSGNNPYFLGRIVQEDLADLQQVVGALAFYQGTLYFAGIYIDRDIQDFRRIVRFEAATGEWRTVHASIAINTTINPSARKRPKDMLDIFFPDSVAEEQSKDKLSDALGVSLASEQAIWSGRSVFCSLLALPGGLLLASLSSPFGGTVLTSENGGTWQTHFEGNPAVGAFTFHQILPFAESWLALSTGLGKDPPPLLKAPSPTAAHWEALRLPNFKDQGNILASQAASFEQGLYLGTRNLDRGFQLLRLGTPDGQDCRAVLTSGAYIFTENQQVAALAELNGCLYVVAGSADPALRSHQVLAPEIFRIYPDQSWDLLVGKPRFSPTGLKVPLAALGRGFDAPTAVLQCFLLHRGQLVAGLQIKDTFVLFATGDGEEWTRLPLDQWGIQPAGELVSALSTPEGLVLVFNPQGQLSSDSASDAPAPPVALEVWLVPGPS
ncbi:hypothetical protein [Gloeobacter kilaueensis]|uniref:Uncharacterized protein n=1 Tax=Gloeobacter kilaueensis (strain ATCC BAA-2537 / CCAP 1431/1 / ULC 316 / JS1) TaxID=1183438 RepID=U5QCY3_GLOK1|nr:hypothetical protein [Gloeobacter kilaueensis]AGY56741.1 hypothetical protein GKIL_0495 [Gloeobacter kilaueensis JS1]